MSRAHLNKYHMKTTLQQFLVILKVHAFYTVRFAFAQTLTVSLDSPNKSTNKTISMRTCGLIEVDHVQKSMLSTLVNLRIFKS